MAPKTTQTKAPAAKAKATPAAAKAKPETKAVAKAAPKEKAVSTMSADELARLAMMAEGASKEVSASDGATFSYLSLAKDKTKALDEDEKELYIPGLQMKEFFIQSTKTRLGKSVKVVPLAFLTVYTEYDGPSGTAKFCGIWHKDDVTSLPNTPGNNFNKVLPNGHEARPQKWVFLYVIGHDELVNPVITYKSTGNKVARNWLKDIQGRDLAPMQSIYTLEGQKQKHDDFTWYEAIPSFEGLVYEREADGTIQPNEDFAAEVMKKSLAVTEAYNRGLLISRKNPESFRNVTEEDGFDSEDDDDEPAF